VNRGSEQGSEKVTFARALRRWAEAERLWHLRPASKGAQAFRDGEGRHVHVLVSGLVKLTYTTESGDEWIKSLIVDEGVFGGQTEAQAAYGATCLERSVIATLPFDRVEAAIVTNETLRRSWLAFSAWLLARKQAREQALLSMSPEARYRDLLATEPALATRLSQGDIARWLGITPVAFSRIKRRMAGRT
jgi:CRP-like cAMP-binding protein